MGRTMEIAQGIAPVRLKANTKVALARDLKALMPGQIGWITIAEAGMLFSAQETDPLSEMDMDGSLALGAFAADGDHRSVARLNRAERRVYFTRR